MTGDYFVCEGKAASRPSSAAVAAERLDGGVAAVVTGTTERDEVVMSFR